MIRQREQSFARVMMALDAAALVLAFAAAYELRATLLAPRYGAPGPFAHYAWLLWLVLPVWLVALRLGGLYRPGTCARAWPMLGALAAAHLLAGLALFATMYLAMRADVSRLLLEAFIASGFILTAAVRLGARLVMGWSTERTRVLVVGERDAARGYLAMVSDELHRSIAVVDVVAPGACAQLANGSARNGGRAGREQWSAALGRFVIDEVVAVAQLGEASSFAALAAAAAERGLVFRMLVTMPGSEVGQYQIEDLGGGSCLISLETVPHDGLQLAAKRVVDITGALAGLIACALVLPCYAWLLRRESPGPVLFRQERRGRNGRRFMLYKFRTMHPDAEQRLPELMARNQMNGHMFKMRDDPRVTPSGRFMRRTHLDELPQFWNVLRGEMSLVGTRPPTPAEVAQYRSGHLRRLSIKPGITGLWQVNGNGAVNDFDKVVRLDCEYIDNWSLWLDAKIIGRTVTKVVSLGGW